MKQFDPVALTMSLSSSSLSLSPSATASSKISAATQVAHTPELLLLILEILQAEHSDNQKTLLQCRQVNRFFAAVVSRILLITVITPSKEFPGELSSHRQLTLAQIADLQAEIDLVTEVVVNIHSIHRAHDLGSFRTLEYPSLRNLLITGTGFKGFQPQPLKVWKGLLSSHLVGLRIEWINQYDQGIHRHHYNPTKDIVQLMIRHCPAIEVCSIGWSSLRDMSDGLWNELLVYLETLPVRRLEFTNATSGMLNGRLESLVSVLARNKYLTHLSISCQYQYDGLFEDMAKENRRPFASLKHLHLDVRETYLHKFTRFILLVPNIQNLYLRMTDHGWDNISRLQTLTNLKTLHLFVHLGPFAIRREIPGHARLCLSFLQKLSTLRTLKIISECEREGFHDHFLLQLQDDFQAAQNFDFVWPKMDCIFMYCPGYDPMSHVTGEDPLGDADIWKKTQDGTFTYERRARVTYVPLEHYRVL